ncbi:MAG TPA: SusD/RagB family nutrient-binding outer membrane lipoprotein [Gemmatimonadaceae bacterium]|nr:SusD/RagB family nutrient-binding outer membrane lipoprotein [Gemmatimonadaceae bacterium]
MMNRTKTFALVAGLGLAAVGCNNDKLTSLNVNPNSPEDVPASTLFTEAARTSVRDFLGSNFDLRGTEWVAQHLAEVQYPDEDTYKRLLSAAGTTPTWFDPIYQTELEDLRKVIAKGTAAKSPGITAPALILRTWDFSYLTNTFGDIPYFSALVGDSIGASFTPKYDKQQDIYTDFFKVLDSASKMLSGASNGLGGADPIYNGNPQKWQKLANSLRLRLAMQILNEDKAMASQQIQAALAAPGGVFTSNADMAIFAWPGDGVYDNPWSVNFQTRDDHRMSQTFMNVLNATNDPRTAIFAQPTVNDPTVYAGMPNGLTQDSASNYFNISSRPGKIFWPGANSSGVSGGTGASQPSFILTYAEVAFIEAEAAANGLGGLNASQAQSFYTAGITASMDQWGVTDQSAINAFLANPNIAYQGGINGQVQIDQQEWVALYTDGGQAWALWRRTCVPNTVVPGPSAIINTVPRRMQYSTTEYSLNADQVQAALTQMGGPDVFTTRMWWDKNPSAAPTFTAGCGTR